MTCLGTTLEFPEVAADILQQTNFSLELPQGAGAPALTLFDWPSRSGGREHLVRVQEVRVLSRHMYYCCAFQSSPLAQLTPTFTFSGPLVSNTI